MVAKFWEVFRAKDSFRRFLQDIYQAYPMWVPQKLLPKVLVFWQMNLPYEKLQLEQHEAMSLGMHFGYLAYANELRQSPWAMALPPEHQAAILDSNVKLATTTVLVLHEFFRNPYLIVPEANKI